LSVVEMLVVVAVQVGRAVFCITLSLKRKLLICGMDSLIQVFKLDEGCQFWGIIWHICAHYFYLVLFTYLVTMSFCVSNFFRIIDIIMTAEWYFHRNQYR